MKILIVPFNVNHATALSRGMVGNYGTDTQLKKKWNFVH